MWNRIVSAALAVPLGALLGGGARQDGVQGPVREPTAQERELVRTLGEHGVTLDPVRGLCAFPVDVVVRDEVLEYLLVGPAGAVHESGFATPVPGSVLNVGLLALGVEPGANATWRPKQPQPTPEEVRAGAERFDVTPPSGDSLYLYLGWRSGGETYFFRIEDLIRNLAAGRAMRRHAWVYLGSKMVPSGRKDGGEAFAADVYQNLICVSFFPEGYTLLTGALEECLDDSIWMLNAWLLPERGTRLAMIASRERIDAPSEAIAKLLPEVAAPATDPPPDDSRQK